MLFKNTALAAKLRVWRKTDKKKKKLDTGEFKYGFNVYSAFP
jgi:hypothetical protein